MASTQTTVDQSLRVTPKSRLKSTPQNNTYYFTYPDVNNHAHNGYSQSVPDTPDTPLNIQHSHAAATNIKIVKNMKYRSISTSPSLSSSSSSPDNIEYPSNPPISNNKRWYFQITNWIKILIVILLITILIVAAIFNNLIIKYSEQFLNWMNNYPIKGSFAYLGLYILCSVVMIPGSILTLGAGFVYVKMFGQIEGVIFASTVVWFGASIGATMAFINGRYLLRNLVEYYTVKSAKFALIDNVVGMNGFKVTFLLRLSPITPYNVFNYFMGLTSVKLKHYIFACIGMIPDTIVYTFIGGSIASIAKLSSVGFASDPILLIVTITGSIISVIGVIYISYIAKKEFNKMATTASRFSINGGIERNNNDIEDIEENKYDINGQGVNTLNNNTLDIAVHDIDDNHSEKMDIRDCNYNDLGFIGNSLGTSLTDLRLIGADTLKESKLKENKKINNKIIKIEDNTLI